MSEPRHIYRCTFGSRLYGTALPASDHDTKGVFLPSADQILLCQPPKTWTAPTVEGQDNESYSLQRYLELLAQCQTVALDMLFAPGDQWKLMDPIWFDITNNAHKIINKKCGAAIGYARAQAEKYSLRGARMDALGTVLDCLRRHPRKGDALELALLQGGQAIQQLEMPARQYVNTSEVADDTGTRFLEVCGKKVGLNCTVALAIIIFENLLNQYGERSKAAQHGGADWKALYHAVRITEQTVELLQTGTITFPRWNAADLIKIRLGEYEPAAVYDRIEGGISKIEEAQALSTLPDEPDREYIAKLVRDVHLEIVTS